MGELSCGLSPLGRGEQQLGQGEQAGERGAVEHPGNSVGIPGQAGTGIAPTRCNSRAVASPMPPSVRRPSPGFRIDGFAGVVGWRYGLDRNESISSRVGEPSPVAVE